MRRFKGWLIMIFLVVVMPVLCRPMIISANDTVQNPPIITLSLEQAVEMSLNRNRNIIMAKNDQESAILNLDSAHSDFDIKLTPSTGVGVTKTTNEITTGITFSKLFYNGISISSTPALGKSDSSYNSRLAVSLNIPLMKYAGNLVNKNSIYTSEFLLRNAEKSSVQTKETIFLNTVKAFYNILELEKIVELNQFLVKRFENYSTIAETKTDVGLADPFDVYRSEIQSKTAQVNLSTSLENLQNANYDLKSFLAIPQNQSIKIKDDIPGISKINLTIENAETIAFKNSIEIKKARDILNEKKRTSRVAKQQTLPDLKLSFLYTRAGDSDELGSHLFDDEETWGLFLVSTGDFERKVAKNNYLQSRYNIRSSEIELENIKDQLSKNVRRQVDMLNKAWDRIGVIKKKIIDTTGKQRLATAKFNNGFTGNLDLVEAETELHQARLDLLRAQINYLNGTYQLRKLLGTLIQYS